MFQSFLNYLQTQWQSIQQQIKEEALNQTGRRAMGGVGGKRGGARNDVGTELLHKTLREFN